MITIYSKTGSSHGYFINQIWKNLSEAKLEEGSIYMYDEHDYVVRGLHIEDCLDEVHWNHLRTDPTTKFMLFYADEYFNYHDLDMYFKCFIEKEIPSDRIWMVVPDKNFEDWTRARFNEVGLVDVHITNLPVLMARCREQEKIPMTTRFSMLCRNYHIWRTEFFMTLMKKEILSKIDYTFHNCIPYGEVEIIPKSRIIGDIEGLGFVVDDEVLTWLEGVPYSLPDTLVTTKFSDVGYNFIARSGINITIESQIDPFYFFKSWKHMDRDIFAVAAFATEKTYKAIACSKPFIMVGSPFFLRDLRKLGFKTFHPFINEYYDEMTDRKQKYFAIADEIIRLNAMNDQEFEALIRSMDPIVEHNLQLFKTYQDTMKLPDEFKWMSDYHAPFYMSHVNGVLG